MPGCGRRGRCRKRREWCRGSLPDRNGDDRRAMGQRARRTAQHLGEHVARHVAPRNCSVAAKASVTEGLRCAPLYGPAITTPVKTAIAQVTMTTIHPAPLPLVRASETFAQTPVPGSSITAVPMNSARTGVMTSRFLRLSLLFDPMPAAAHGLVPAFAALFHECRSGFG